MAPQTAIRTVKQRAALKPANAPYWHAIGTGQHVGYRKTESGGTWSARHYDKGTRKRQFRSFGDLSGIAPSRQYDEAAKLARQFFDHADKGGTSETVTVAEAWRRYAAWTRKDRRPGKRVRGPEAAERAAQDIEARCERHIANDPIGRIALDKLRERHVADWRDRVSEAKAAATANRDLAPMRAALNFAKSRNVVTTDQAWAEALKPQRGVDGRRDNYLTRDQRRALIEAADPAFQPFLRMLCTMPIRVGAVAALTAGNYDARRQSLRVGIDKGHAPRAVPLPDNVAALLQDETRDKLPGAALFARPDGGHWTKTQWLDRVKAAAHAADLPPETCSYDLRHSGLTDLITSGMDLFTASQLGGTSVLMLEKHYGHLQEEQARQGLGVLAL